MGRTGCGDYSERYNPTQVILEDGTPLTNVAQVLMHSLYTFFLRNDGTVWATGDNNYYGQLGVGDDTNRSNPTQVILEDGTPLTNVAQVNIGENHTLFLRNDGTVWATGSNDYGQLGVGDNTNRSNPTQVILEDGTPLTNVAQVNMGWDSTTSFFLRNDGTVWATGYNDSGNWVWGMIQIDTTQPRSSYQMGLLLLM